MSKPPGMEDLTVKFHSDRPSVGPGVDCDEATIWQAPEGSLYRVVQRLDPAEFQIATLVPTGRITLLTLHKETNGVADQDEAMNHWLDIRNLPPTSNGDWVGPAGPHRTTKGTTMAELSIDEVVQHFTTSDGNGWIATDEYTRADTERRTQIRAAVADRIRNLLVDGTGDGDLIDGAVTAENICNGMWHLMSHAAQEDTLAQPEPVENTA
ncbi:hypothetical protein ACFWNK_19940 [Streptomyces sp. NPDC058417]|uniref:hypothetical protein n=1 Tax=unclassified Streptomyces TaxID=2593676 RepID=UPI0036696A5A